MNTHQCYRWYNRWILISVIGDTIDEYSSVLLVMQEMNIHHCYRWCRRWIFIIVIGDAGDEYSSLLLVMQEMNTHHCYRWGRRWIFIIVIGDTGDAYSSLLLVMQEMNIHHCYWWCRRWILISVIGDVIENNSSWSSVLCLVLYLSFILNLYNNNNTCYSATYPSDFTVQGRFTLLPWLRPVGTNTHLNSPGSIHHMLPYLDQRTNSIQ